MVADLGKEEGGKYAGEIHEHPPEFDFFMKTHKPKASEEKICSFIIRKNALRKLTVFGICAVTMSEGVGILFGAGQTLFEKRAPSPRSARGRASI